MYSIFDKGLGIIQVEWAQQPRVSEVPSSSRPLNRGRDTGFSSVALWSCSDEPWSAVLRWRGDNWIISAGNQLGLCACDGTRVKQRLAETERERGVDGGSASWSIILDTPLPHIPPFSPSCSLSPRSPPSIAYLVDKRDQIAYFHLNELSPNKRQGSGDRLQTPKYPAITRANGTTMQKKRQKGGEGGRGGGRTKDIFIY